MPEPLVSIIMPVYNTRDLLSESVQSVLHQTYREWELIMVDDFSTDGSGDIAEDLAGSDPRISCVRLEQNMGAANARNRAIKLAKGRFIAFLDADDLWLPTKLEKQVQFALDRNVAITHTAYEWMDAKGNPLGKIIRAPRRLNYHRMLDYNYIGCLTAMIDRDVIGDKRYMPDIKKRQDYALWLSILRVGHEAEFLDEVLALYRTGRKSLSSNKWSAARYNFQLMREVEGLSLPKACYHFIRYMIIAFRKYYAS